MHAQVSVTKVNNKGLISYEVVAEEDSGRKHVFHKPHEGCAKKKAIAVAEEFSDKGFFVSI